MLPTVRIARPYFPPRPPAFLPQEKRMKQIDAAPGK